MKYKHLYIAFVALAVAFTGCQKDLLDEGYENGTPAADANVVVTLATARTDGKLSLAVDAGSAHRPGVWIDLNGDGLRATDASEDITAFDTYIEYLLPEGTKTVDIYGAITYLGAAENQLTGLDVSGNTHLTTLNVPLNELRAIDLGRNTLLERLDLSGNRLTALNVSANKALLSLWVFNNELKSLDLSANTSLAFLDCSGNGLTHLDVTRNTGLVRLLCHNNALTSLDISRNGLLNRLWLFGNQLAEKETESLIAALANATRGDLWITDKPLTPAMATAAGAKGWVAQ
ncbi:hypothetical protein [Proteiniphilum sp.]|uniref:leucine-rich repeat domain-containing protein n=1 Tax=Proteiniphilum sp. TaxID=1926877 RepID=UPI002B2077DB|nr:hypothetical protein [Proteiniphilum sp.]MEA4916802.1 hypothetical protein [Proteiniphilum sp.]